MILKHQEVREGLTVRRIDGEGDQAQDIGRTGIVQKNNAYNNIAHTMTVLYPSDGTQQEKIDECCTPFEFERL